MQTQALSSLACLSLGLSLSLACGASGDDAGAADADGQGPAADARIYSDAAPCEQSIDVVFALDVSSSMRFVLEDLEANIGGVVSAANELSPDSHFGLIAFVDNHAVDMTGSDGAVHTTAESLTAAFAHYRNVYTANDRNPGDGPSGPTVQNPVCEENSLDALYAATAEYPWRQNSARIVIVATDDTFLEPPDNYGDGNGDGDTTDFFPFTEGDYPALHTVAETTAALQQERIRVFSFTRLTPPGIFSRCGTGRRSEWEEITMGWSTPYKGQTAFPEATDGKNFDLAQVQSGALSLADTINEVVLESHCKPID